MVQLTHCTLVMVMSVLLDSQHLRLSERSERVLPEMHVRRSSLRADWGAQVPEAEWEGYYSAGMRPRMA